MGKDQDKHGFYHPQGEDPDPDVPEDNMSPAQMDKFLDGMGRLMGKEPKKKPHPWAKHIKKKPV
jgi:hypothetical protein